MKVILTQTIDSLGMIGSEADVAKGYARNYLIPQGKAVLATPQNRKKLEHENQIRSSDCQRTGIGAGDGPTPGGREVHGCREGQ